MKVKESGDLLQLTRKLEKIGSKSSQISSLRENEPWDAPNQYENVMEVTYKSRTGDQEVW